MPQASHRMPMPSMHVYWLATVGMQALVTQRALNIVNTDEWQADSYERLHNASTMALSNGILRAQARHSFHDNLLVRLLVYVLTDHLATWTALNTLACLVFTLGYALRSVVFGRLRTSETQMMQDRLMNFVFEKFVFIFGVLNTKYFDEVLLWSIWFMAIALVSMLATLAHNRYKHISSTAASTSRAQRTRIVVLMAMGCGVSTALFAVAVAASHHCHVNYVAFLAADCLGVLAVSLYGVTRYLLYAYEESRARPPDRRLHVQYTLELVFELLILVVDFVHHLHMLLWGEYFLSMASLVIAMQLRQIYHRVDARLGKHRKHRKNTRMLDEEYETVTAVDDDRTCAICWDELDKACKLPCGHLFHNWCLLSWMEHDSTCPTCRRALVRPSSSTPPSTTSTNEHTTALGARLLAHTNFNHFFHFDGPSYARWLPSLSVEVTHNLAPFAAGVLRRNPAQQENLATDETIRQWAEQINDMFPQLTREMIALDLQETQSMEATIDSIIDGRLVDDLELEDDGEESDDVGSEASHASSWTLDRHASFAHVPQLETQHAHSDELLPPLDMAGLSLEEKKRALVHRHRTLYVRSERGADLRNEHEL